MRRYLSLFFFIGLAWGQNKVNINNLVKYGDKMFEQNEDKPYTGRVFDLSKTTGEKILEGRYNHGKKSGMWTHYTDDCNGKYKLNYGNGEININDFVDDIIEYLNESGGKINTPVSGVFIDEFGKRYQGRFVLDEDEVGKFKKIDGGYLELYSSLDDFSKYPRGFYSMKNEYFHGTMISWYKNGKKKQEGEIKNGERSGVWTYWYDNGKKKEEGEWIYGEDKIKRGGRDEYGRGQFWYENEKKDGLWIYYTEKGNGKYRVKYGMGNIISVQYLDNLGGKFEGELLLSKDDKEKNNGNFIIKDSYDFTVTPKKLVSYKNGKLDGLITRWFEKRGKYINKYEEGKKVGIGRIWYENGNLREESNYENDKRNGLVTMYYENGPKNAEVFCQDGKWHGLYKQWYESGKIMRENNYNMGKIDGLFLRWYENGQKQFECSYILDKYDGMYYEWYENGQKKKEGNTIDGEEDGIWKEWYENGQMKFESTFKSGKEVSLKKWNEDGSVKE